MYPLAVWCLSLVYDDVEAANIAWTVGYVSTIEQDFLINGLIRQKNDDFYSGRSCYVGWIVHCDGWSTEWYLKRPKWVSQEPCWSIPRIVTTTNILFQFPCKFQLLYYLFVMLNKFMEVRFLLWNVVIFNLTCRVFVVIFPNWVSSHSLMRLNIQVNPTRSNLPQIRTLPWSFPFKKTDSTYHRYLHA